jgi:hypothetical protein
VFGCGGREGTHIDSDPARGTGGATANADGGSAAGTAGTTNDSGSGADSGTPGAGGRATAGDAAGYMSPLCSGASFESADQVVAAGISGSDLVLVTASGATRNVATFDVPSGVSPYARLSTEGGRVTASLDWTTNLAATGETIRLGAAFEVLYRLPAVAGIASDAGITVAADRFIKADGTVVKYQDAGQDLSITFHGPPDADGWMLASWQRVNELGNHEGALNVDGRIRPFFDWPQTDMYSIGTLAGQQVLLHGTNAFTLTFETTAGFDDVPLDIQALGATPLSLWFDGSASIGLVSSSYDSRLFRVDGATRTVMPLGGAPVPMDVTSVTVSSDGGWFLGTDGESFPTWEYDARGDRLSVVTPDTVANLTRMIGGACGKSSILSDGRVAVGLRDTSTAGLYVGSNDAGFRRIGLPLRNVTAVSGENAGESWIVTGNSGTGSYCTGYEPYTTEGSDAGTVIEGDSVQIVAPRRPPIVFTFDSEWSLGTTLLHPSGTCASHGDANIPTTVYDLVTGGTTEIASMAAFAWMR